MSKYVARKEHADTFRLPLQGRLDVTYRCNNNCRHCWVQIPVHSPRQKEELSYVEIKKIVDEARMLGCRAWALSGGEPLLRPDFKDIFEYVTHKAVSYTLNTNGALIDPGIARLFRRKGVTMVALYGATADVHDHITRTPGSFEATMRGFAYLKEAGAGFMAQLVPMRDNYHQMGEMIALAESFTPLRRIGAPWLWLSAPGDAGRNEEIRRQRLDPKTILELDKPDLSFEESLPEEDLSPCRTQDGADRLFSPCILSGRQFHIDPYGAMTFCSFIVDPAMRYDLRRGSFKSCWEEFIPSLAGKIWGGAEYAEKCGPCKNRRTCRWCPAYGYLEHRRYSAAVEHLCDIAKDERQFADQWKRGHRRWFRIAGITVQVDSELPITEATFHPKFKLFEAEGPSRDAGAATVHVSHHFSYPHLDKGRLGEEVHRVPPWVVYRRDGSWVYVSVSPDGNEDRIHQLAVFSHDYTRARIYSQNADHFNRGGLRSLTLMPTDQILLAQVLSDREGCFVHSSGVILNGKGLLFVGHSGAGKSTVAGMLAGDAEILCDDRMIIRGESGALRIHGTWSHGDIPTVSPASAPLTALLFLDQAGENRLEPVHDKRIILQRLLPCLIKPLVSQDWWGKTLALAGRISREAPCYVLHFDKSGAARDLLGALAR